MCCCLILFFYSIHEQLLQKESGPRWPRDGDELKKFLQINEDRERLAIMKELHTLAVDRWFLLHLKKRYAGEHKVLFVVGHATVSLRYVCIYKF